MINWNINRICSALYVLLNDWYKIFTERLRWIVNSTNSSDDIQVIKIHKTSTRNTKVIMRNKKIDIFPYESYLIQ